MLLDLQILRKITLVLMEEKNWVSFTSFWKKDKNYTFLFQDKKKIGSNFSSEDSHERNNNRSVHPFVIQYIIFQFFEYKKKGLIRVRNILFLVL